MACSGLLRVSREELPVEAPFHVGSSLPQCQVSFSEGMEDLPRPTLPRTIFGKPAASKG